LPTSVPVIANAFIAAIATFALKADAWFRRGLLLMLSLDSRATLAAVRQELQFITLCRFPKPAFLPRTAGHAISWRLAVKL
jgi:hypothetical protein